MTGVCYSVVFDYIILIRKPDKKDLQFVFKYVEITFAAANSFIWVHDYKSQTAFSSMNQNFLTQFEIRPLGFYLPVVGVRGGGLPEHM